MLFKKVKLLSTPGRRQYWNLTKLNIKYSYGNFSGFYIISSNKGLITSGDALLKYRTGGEMLIKITYNLCYLVNLFYISILIFLLFEVKIYFFCVILLVFFIFFYLLFIFF